VNLNLQIAGRLADRVEAGAYYIVSEALANVAKHANAGMVEVFVEVGRRVLSLSVRDDGVGGADPGRGTSVHVRLPTVAR
jgi:signal transduction histidine kinase